MTDGVVVERRRRASPSKPKCGAASIPVWSNGSAGHNSAPASFRSPRGRRTIALEYPHRSGMSADGRRDAIYELPLRFPVPLDELRAEDRDRPR